MNVTGRMLLRESEMGVASLRRDTFFAFCDIRIIKEELKLKAKLRRLTKGVTHFLLFCDI